MNRPPCTNWDGDRCTLGLYGGQPSPGVCFACDQYQGKPRGLGDRVERVIAATGVPKLMKAAGIPCNCSQRRTALNQRTKKD